MLTEKDRQLYERQATVLSALASPTRLAIAAFLEGGEQCVCDIATHLGEERSNVSRHLASLLRAGVVGSRKEGVKVFYSLKTPCVLQVLGCVSSVLRTNLAEDVELLRGA
jgi:ArsR family transcriptional regulator